MGLKGDFDEVAKVWTAAPWRVKIYLFISALLASSSVASLSEAIFKWKSFFLDALLFYRAWLTTPVASAWSKVFGSTLPESFFDYAVAHLLISGATLRYIFFVNRSVRARIFETLYIVGMTVLSLRNIALFAQERDILPIAIYLLFLLFVGWWTKGAARIIAIAWLVAPVAIVSILAAANAGLSR